MAREEGEFWIYCSGSGEAGWQGWRRVARVFAIGASYVRPNQTARVKKAEKFKFGGERSTRRVSTPPFGWDGNFQPLH